MCYNFTGTSVSSGSGGGGGGAGLGVSSKTPSGHGGGYRLVASVGNITVNDNVYRPTSKLVLM